MKLLLERQAPGATCMLGSLFVDGVFECFTLEDVPREVKVPGETAIPAGTYKVELTFSPRFQKVMPLLIGVPGFEGVRIHTGNTDRDTEGCILVGNSPNGEFLGDSRRAYDELFSKLQDANFIDIEIRNAEE